ncbi:preprotein translocase subunit SecY [Spiroplasma endosymbiont of Tipula paludosa]|uniref:preprotein translocase subunit SecY n=1 Tax=Spiroplasma endosymbiont of Tipula paludosa TaxID=3066295 RepID=UPI0035C9068C
MVITTIKRFYRNNKDILLKLAFTLLVLFIIRLGALITVPGVNINKNLNESNKDSREFFNLIAMLGGGSIDRFSLFALGLSPYITASIIVQLLSTDLVPGLSRWAKSGEKGKRKLDSLTKWLTLPFGIMQGFATIMTLAQQKIISLKWQEADAGNIATSAVFYYILVPTLLLGGTFLILWLADQITIRGIGNGVSLVIFAGIASSLPFNIAKTFQFWVGGQSEAIVVFSGFLKFLLYMVGFLLVILMVVFFAESERRIPIQQTGSGLALKSEKAPYLPLKINSAGVIPVIFASAIITAPLTIAQIVKANNPEGTRFTNFTETYLALDSWSGMSIFAILIILFTFLYSQVQINPEQMAENFQKNGTFIPGIQPGKETEKYIKSTLNRLSVVGSIFLAFVAILPTLISKLTNLPPMLAIGGTGVIIMVGVAIEVIRQVQGHLTQQSYIQFKRDENQSKNIW